MFKITGNFFLFHKKRKKSKEIFKGIFTKKKSIIKLTPNKNFLQKKISRKNRFKKFVLSKKI